MIHQYSARILETVPGQGGVWAHLRVGVFRQVAEREEQIGEYRRNYPSLLSTFFPFRVGDQALALYSPDYTATRLMALPSCRDLGGESPADGGFCPVDFFVPTYLDYTTSVDGSPPRPHRKQMPGPDLLVARDVPVRYPARPGYIEKTELHRHQPLGPLMYHSFGFVAGCIWGDDSSWKLQYLDLSRAAEGVLKRDDRFGYVPLPGGQPLSALVNMSDYQYHPTDEYASTIGITTVQRFDIRTGAHRPAAI